MLLSADAIFKAIYFDWLESSRYVLIELFRIVLANRAKNIQHHSGAIDRHGAVRCVGWDDVERARARDSCLVSDRQLDLTLQHYSALLVRVAVKRNHRVAIKLEIGQH